MRNSHAQYRFTGRMTIARFARGGSLIANMMLRAMSSGAIAILN